MDTIKIHIIHCGRVRISPNLPYGGSHCSLLKASGLTTRAENRLWLPVSAYLIEHPKGLLLIDTGWSRAMSPEGTFDTKAQIAHLGFSLYLVNQGEVPLGQAIDEQLAARGIASHDLDCVLLTHLDCDHASGLSLVKDAKRFLVSSPEVAGAKRNPLRFHKKMWEGIALETFDFEDTGEGPFGRSYDLFGDSSVQLISIPGHSDGLCAVKITGADGRFVLLFSDGGYSSRSWQDMIRPGVTADGEKQMASLEWIRQQSLDDRCIVSLANHDPEVTPRVLSLPA